jgi:hypothetical protein
MVPVRLIPERLFHEEMPRHPPHRREHPRLRHPAPGHLLLDHSLALAREALHAEPGFATTLHRFRFATCELNGPSQAAMVLSAP